MPLSGSRIKVERERKQLTQKELAELCHITLYQISRYENEKSDITINSLESLARHLEVSTDYLLGLSDDRRGVLDRAELEPIEKDLVATLRREGWRGVIRFSAERIKD